MFGYLTFGSNKYGGQTWLKDLPAAQFGRDVHPLVAYLPVGLEKLGLLDFAPNLSFEASMQTPRCLKGRDLFRVFFVIFRF